MLSLTWSSCIVWVCKSVVSQKIIDVFIPKIFIQLFEADMSTTHSVFSEYINGGGEGTKLTIPVDKIAFFS